jgi:hypothetical protein
MASLRTTTAITGLKAQKNMDELKASLRIATENKEHLRIVADMAIDHETSKPNPIETFNNYIRFDPIKGNKNDNDIRVNSLLNACYPPPFSPPSHPLNPTEHDRISGK